MSHQPIPLTYYTDEDPGAALEVGHGVRSIALQILGIRYRGVVLSPYEARELAVQLIEAAYKSEHCPPVESAQ